jgi:DNA-binding NarL/FixJ family response regulator
MSARIAVYVYGTDLVSQAGVAAQLRGRPETYVVDDTSIDDAVVAVVVVDGIDDGLARIVRGIQREGCPRVVLVATSYDNADLVVAIEAGVIDVVLRQDVTPELLARSVVAAARPNNAHHHPAGTARPVQPVGRHERTHSARADMLSSREVQVLELLADGLDTQEIAGRLAYSERTIKGIIHGVTTRLNLRNRAHAVAYAIKSGVL